MSKSSNTILIVAAMKEEYEAVVKAINSINIAEKADPDVLVGYEYIDYVVGNGKIRIAHVGPMMADSTKLVVLHNEKFKPTVVLMAGICAGDIKRCDKGDVIISSAVWIDGFAKQYLGNIEKDIVVMQPSEQFVAKTRDQLKYAFEKSCIPIIDRRPTSQELEPLYGPNGFPATPSVKWGDYYCTIQVEEFDDYAFKNLRDIRRHTLAIDMESYSLGLTLKDERAEWAVIKCVQDYGQQEVLADGRIIPKNDMFRRYACMLSARCCIYVALQNINLPSFGDDSSKNKCNNIGSITNFTNIITDKISDEFESLCVTSEHKLNESINLACKVAKKTRSLSPLTDKAIALTGIPNIVFDGNIPSNHLDQLRHYSEVEPIRVSCPAIYPSCIAALDYLQSNYGVKVSIDTYYTSSIELFDIGLSNPYDFIIAAQDPYHIISTHAIDRYLVVCPILRSPQFLYYNLDAGVPNESLRKIVVVPGSSAVSHAELMLSQGSELDSRVADSASDLLRVINSLDHNELLPVWSPISKRLESIENARKLENSCYDIFVCLYTSAQYNQSGRSKSFVEPFRNALIASLNVLSSDLPATANRLCADTNFLSAYASGSGFSIDDLRDE